MCCIHFMRLGGENMKGKVTCSKELGMIAYQLTKGSNECQWRCILLRPLISASIWRLVANNFFL